MTTPPIHVKLPNVTKTSPPNPKFLASLSTTIPLEVEIIATLIHLTL
jgi:hypothetical protein